MSEIILYDLPSKDRCACWSFNPWKARLALNYKGLDYKTEWVEYPDIAPKFKSLGIPPNESNTSASYTIPTARFNHDEYIMDSRKIAAKLEQLVPSSSLHVDSDMVPRVENLIPKIMMPLLGLFADKTVSVLLSPPSVEYFKRVQFERFGMPFAQLVEEHPVDWEKAAGVLRHFGDLLRVNAGTFLLGDKPSFADFGIVGMLQWFKRMDEGILQKAREIEPALGALYDASSAWLVRDDY